MKGCNDSMPETSLHNQNQGLNDCFRAKFSHPWPWFESPEMYVREGVQACLSKGGYVSFVYGYVCEHVCTNLSV